MFGLGQKKPVPESTSPAAPTLDQLRAELKAILTEADARVERMLERLRAREAKERQT